MATYLMLFTCGQILKLISFHHVYHDNRKLIRKLEVLQEEELYPEVNILGLPKEVYQEALKYPNNLKLSHYIRYLVAPTCCY